MLRSALRDGSHLTCCPAGVVGRRAAAGGHAPGAARGERIAGRIAARAIVGAVFVDRAADVVGPVVVEVGSAAIGELVRSAARVGRIIATAVARGTAAGRRLPVALLVGNETRPLYWSRYQAVA
jgi:hypothetical protein